jgi:hypothetical protein
VLHVLMKLSTCLYMCVGLGGTKGVEEREKVTMCRQWKLLVSWSDPFFSVTVPSPNFHNLLWKTALG